LKGKLGEGVLGKGLVCGHERERLRGQPLGSQRADKFWEKFKLVGVNEELVRESTRTKSRRVNSHVETARVGGETTANFGVGGRSSFHWRLGGSCRQKGHLAAYSVPLKKVQRLR